MISSDSIIPVAVCEQVNGRVNQSLECNSMICLV